MGFDFGVEYEVPRQNVVTQHQVPQSLQIFDIEKFISNCNIYFKSVHLILLNNLKFFKSNIKSFTRICCSSVFTQKTCLVTELLVIKTR